MKNQIKSDFKVYSSQNNFLSLLGLLLLFWIIIYLFRETVLELTATQKLGLIGMSLGLLGFIILHAKLYFKNKKKAKDFEGVNSLLELENYSLSLYSVKQKGIEISKGYISGTHIGDFNEVGKAIKYLGEKDMQLYANTLTSFNEMKKIGPFLSLLSFEDKDKVKEFLKHLKMPKMKEDEFLEIDEKTSYNYSMKNLSIKAAKDCIKEMNDGTLAEFLYSADSYKSLILEELRTRILCESSPVLLSISISVSRLYKGKIKEWQEYENKLKPLYELGVIRLQERSLKELLKYLPHGLTLRAVVLGRLEELD